MNENIMNQSAVYIPDWLLMRPVWDISLAAKILYGRLAYWSNEAGIASRTINQLAADLGMSRSNILRLLKGLKNLGLIRSYKKSLGGKNYYRFLEHPWMF